MLSEEAGEALLAKLKSAIASKNLDEANLYHSQCLEEGVHTIFKNEFVDIKHALKLLTAEYAAEKEERVSTEQILKRVTGDNDTQGENEINLPLCDALKIDQDEGCALKTDKYFEAGSLAATCGERDHSHLTAAIASPPPAAVAPLGMHTTALIGEEPNALKAGHQIGSGAKTDSAAAEAALRAREEVAREARFKLQQFPNLCTADDFAHGVLFNKAKVKENFLSYQPSVIPRSLTKLSSSSNLLAKRVHKDMLTFMSETLHLYQEAKAAAILQLGFEHEDLRDEIYLQLIKQLTGNSHPNSIAKGWQLLCMCVATFAPSKAFDNFLLHFLLEKRDGKNVAVSDYARYCLRVLDITVDNCCCVVPSLEQILAYKERPPMLATIYLLDGTMLVEKLPLSPDMNVAQVLKQCTVRMNLTDPRSVSTLGIFVYDLGAIGSSSNVPDATKEEYADLKRTPRPLRDDDFMGNVVVTKACQRRNFKFVLKRKIFSPKSNYRGSDSIYERLVYLQAVDDVIEEASIEVASVDQASLLAAIAIAVAFGKEMPDSVAALEAKEVCQFIPREWRSAKSSSQWAAAVLQHRAELIGVDVGDLQERFLQLVRKSPHYGSHWFYCHKAEAPFKEQVPSAVRQLPRDLLIAFNSEGLHIYTFRRQLLLSFVYHDIFRWGGSSKEFHLIISVVATGESQSSYEFVLITAQAAAMAAILQDYILAVMKENEEEKKRK